MNTVKSLYEDSIAYEEPILAHYILHLLQEGKIKLDDNVSDIDFSQADYEKVKQMIESNVLGFSEIKAFSLKYDKEKYAFVFAKDESEAQSYLEEKCRKRPINCIEISLDEPITTGRRTLTFRELRKEYQVFPGLAGVYER